VAPIGVPQGRAGANCFRCIFRLWKGLPGGSPSAIGRTMRPLFGGLKVITLGVSPHYPAGSTPIARRCLGCRTWRFSERKPAVSVRRQIAHHQRLAPVADLYVGHNTMTLPSVHEAPIRLWSVEGNCGLLVAWVVLRHFGLRTSCTSLIRSCGHTRRYGVFTIALASALQERGLHVTFHSDPDPDIKPTERRFYGKAKRLGIPVLSGQSLNALLQHVRKRRVVIVFYDTPEGEGHFSALLGERRGHLILPQSDSGHMPRGTFLRAWRAPGIARQCIVVADNSQRRPNNSMQRMGASRSGQSQFVRQRLLAPTADAAR
jgi:hypothetical protein